MLTEDSPLTIAGSFTEDLILSKMWLCSTLCDLGFSDFKDICILGSWYGNLALVMRVYPIRYDRMLLIDKDPACLSISQKIFDSLGDRRISCEVMDANEIRYPRNISMVINTSCNDIQGDSWYRRIPNGCAVALQSRDDYEDLKDLDSRFQMSKIMYLGTKSLNDPEGPYVRLMKIGLKGHNFA